MGVEYEYILTCHTVIGSLHHAIIWLATPLAHVPSLTWLVAGKELCMTCTWSPHDHIMIAERKSGGVSYMQLFINKGSQTSWNAFSHKTLLQLLSCNTVTIFNLLHIILQFHSECSDFGMKLVLKNLYNTEIFKLFNTFRRFHYVQNYVFALWQETRFYTFSWIAPSMSRLF